MCMICCVQYYLPLFSNHPPPSPPFTLSVACVVIFFGKWCASMSVVSAFLICVCVVCNRHTDEIENMPLTTPAHTLTNHLRKTTAIGVLSFVLTECTGCSSHVLTFIFFASAFDTDHDMHILHGRVQRGSTATPLQIYFLGGGAS